MRYRRLAVAVLAVAASLLVVTASTWVSVSTPPHAAGTVDSFLQDSLAARVDALMAPWDRPGSPGAAIALVRDGEVVYARGYGLANLEYGIPITPASVFHIASISKQFTAFAIGLLAQQGKLSLDDDIRRHLPEVPDFGATITIRHLIHHTSGLRDQWELLAMAGWRLDDVITREHILKMVEHQQELNFAPGTEHLYSNTGYTLLAEIVARVSGQSFPEFAEERIFRPLGMTRTHFHDDHQRVVPGRAYSYSPDRAAGWRYMPLNYANVGATSLFTTVEDLAKWDRNFFTGEVGGAGLLEEMLTRGRLRNGRSLPYAHGLMWGNYRSLITLGHTGADAGYRTAYLRFPEQRFSVIVLSNLSTFNPVRLAQQIADVSLASEMPAALPQRGQEVSMQAGAGAGEKASSAGASEPLVARESRDVGSEAATARAPIRLAPAQLARYAGTYYSPELGTTYELRVREAGLVAEHRRHPDTPLTPTQRDAFAGHSWWFHDVRFTRDSRGRIDGFRLTGSRVRNVRFERVGN
jgi:CubicO group peptidase (beta-lactamase class C family)